MRRLRYWTIVLLITTSWFARGQDVDSLSRNVDSLLLGDDLDFLITGDSISLLHLIDSLLRADQWVPSQILFKVGYNSNVLSAGRTLGIENFGLSPGIAYYHRSGFYADVTSYWSRDFVPRYYLTVLTAGYSYLFNKYLSATANYDRYFYNLGGDGFVPYSNTLSVTPTFDVKKVSATLNYSFYFGDKNAHRIAPMISARLEIIKKPAARLRMALLPALLMLLGNETFYETETWVPQTRFQAIQYYQQYGTIYPTFTRERREFGIMNYAISLPFTLRYKKLSALFNYSYNIPKALPGETLTLSKSSYLTASVSYALTLRTASAAR